MIRRVKKTPLLRYGLIVLLIALLFSGVVYLYSHYNGTRQLQTNISKLITARENSELIDSCLLNLYTADNNSRLYALTGDKKYITQFSKQLSSINGLISRLKLGNGPLADAEAKKLKQLISDKTSKTNNYIRLKQLTDSLISHSLKVDSHLAQRKVKWPTQRTIRTTVRVDTVTRQIKTVSVPEKKKKLLGRVLSAITGKKNVQATDTMVSQTFEPILIKRDSQTTVETSTIIPASKKAPVSYQRIIRANARLRRNEQDMLLVNNNLLVDIINELKKYKNTELAFAAESKIKVARSFTEIFDEYNYLSKLTLGAFIALLIAVLYNIWKIFSNEVDLIAYSEKAEEYARNKSNFLASMSHEIRTPLNSLIGFSEQLGMSELTPEQTVQINAIRSSSQMLLEVVNEILDFSKYETGKMNFERNPFMPHAAINEVFNGVGIQAAKKGLTFKKRILFDEDICFTGDVLRLKQVVMNLLVNAIKFTPKGEVFLQAVVSRRFNNKCILKVRVKDTGVGIKKNSLSTVFEEFSQVNDAQKVSSTRGTGLGLAICKKIVELQGGRIKVISEPGKGSVFSFELPFDISDKSNCVNESYVSDIDLRSLVTGAHILLAEDNQLNVLLAKTILKKWNISCDVAYNGQEAFTLFERNKYDMVLTDIEMPIMGGLELLSLIRNSANSLKAELPVIALTANVLKESRDKYFSAGINGIVLKPFNERNLIEKISQVLRNKYTKTDNLLAKYEEEV